ncbi:hypothetical protein TERTU_4484 [Teredinibacter turnerae T7901]|uniref:Uncharacterized protein n=1 Tax=Teredinibacter turnerae (strain ATCC 39867 / T7901) TaxID=377629 RepID=C5BJ71_TERTT|nr:hypothetical protein [Teredinibacter turnerae]ACR10984.1 hypothetical protein TERTU_4484 [Teredinibacter turnerae T7901]
MYTRLIGIILENNRPELLGAALVVIYGGTYIVGYYLLQLIATLIGWVVSINFYMLNIFIGCIGVGELCRGLAKTAIRCKSWKYDLICTAIAGAFCVGTFWVLMVFKWSHNTFNQVPLAALAGATFYLVLAGTLALEGRKKF